MRVLVTGATGFLGNNVVRSLLARGDEVVAAIRPQSPRDALRGLPVEIVTVDYDHDNDLSSAMHGVDAVVHTAALIQLGWSRLESSRRANVDLTARLASIARRKQIRMIHVSTVDALGKVEPGKVGDETMLDPPHPACSYVVSKREAETAFLAEVADGLDGVIVNPGFLVGPYDWKPSSGEMMLAIHRSLIVFCPAGGCSVADVRDVADGILSAIEHGRRGQRYILGGENLTYFDLWTRIANTIGCGGPRFRLGPLLAGSVGFVGDQISRWRNEEVVFNSAAIRMGQLFHWYRSDKAIAELGYRVGSIDNALADAWDWFVAEGYPDRR